MGGAARCKTAHVATPVTDIEVRGPTIRLGQLLKLTGLVDSGGEARPQLGAGRVSVNGAVEARRGRQLRDGDIVELNGAAVRVVISDPPGQG